MFKRISMLVAALALALGTFGATAVTSPAPVAAAGPCNQNTMPPDQTQQFWIDKYASKAGYTFFDGVRGDATIRNLDICIGTSNQGMTEVLPANIQGDTGIIQLGYGQKPGYAPLWFYADGTADMQIKASSLCPPINGNRVRFSITRTTTYHPSFSISDLTAGCGISWTGAASWNSSYDFAWWGYEANGNASGLGPSDGTSVNMAYMAYNGWGASSWLFRTDLTNAVGTCESCMKNNAWVISQAHGSIGTWVYTNDKFNVWTTR